MGCNYINLIDLCENKYTYAYISSSGENDPVYRIDKDSGVQTIVSLSNNLDTIDPCNPTQEENIITSWECYQIWKTAGNIPFPSIDALKNQKKTEIQSAHDTAINTNFSTTSNGSAVTLDRSFDGQLDLLSVMINAQLEEQQGTVSLPASTINPSLPSLSYNEWKNVVVKYSDNINKIDALKKQTFQNVDRANTVDHLENISWTPTALEPVGGCGPGYTIDSAGNCVPITQEKPPETWYCIV